MASARTRERILNIKRLWTLALALALLLVALPACRSQEPSTEFTVSETYGQTTYRHTTEEAWQAAQIGLVLDTGGQVRTAVGASALLQAEDGLVRLAPNTTLALNTDEQGNRLTFVLKTNASNSERVEIGELFAREFAPASKCRESPEGQVWRVRYEGAVLGSA